MVVLKGIPAILSPELLYALAKMGHGDELVLADVNFPTSSVCACGPKEIRADGLGIPQLLEAILKLFPLDTYVTSPAAVMDRVDADKLRNLPVPVWDVYSNLLSKSGSNADLELVERFEFYDRAKAAFAVVATGYLVPEHRAVFEANKPPCLYTPSSSMRSQHLRKAVVFLNN
uniref:Fucose mutarotase n=1 Tax=Cynoglossus semilaevis TaxID=244447 RepID=A0A3P8V9T9_CYNSE